MFRGKTAESGVITASLKIPVPSSATVIDDSVIDDIPFIEDSERHQLTLGKSDLMSLFCLFLDEEIPTILWLYCILAGIDKFW